MARVTDCVARPDAPGCGPRIGTGIVVRARARVQPDRLDGAAVGCPASEVAGDGRIHLVGIESRRGAL